MKLLSAYNLCATVTLPLDLSHNPPGVYIFNFTHPPRGGGNKNDFTDVRLLNVGKKYDFSHLGKGIKMIKMENIYPCTTSNVNCL